MAAVNDPLGDEYTASSLELGRVVTVINRTNDPNRPFIYETDKGFCGAGGDMCYDFSTGSGTLFTVLPAGSPDHDPQVQRLAEELNSKIQASVKSFLKTNAALLAQKHVHLAAIGSREKGLYLALAQRISRDEIRSLEGAAQDVQRPPGARGSAAAA